MLFLRLIMMVGLWPVEVSKRRTGSILRQEDRVRGAAPMAFLLGLLFGSVCFVMEICVCVCVLCVCEYIDHGVFYGFGEGRS